MYGQEIKPQSRESSDVGSSRVLMPQYTRSSCVAHPDETLDHDAARPSPATTIFGVCQPLNYYEYKDADLSSCSF